MRTKAYKRLIEEGMAAGEIPEDIGRTILSRIESCGKMTPEIYNEFTAALAGRGLYNVYTTPLNRNPPPVTGDFPYESHNVFYLAFKGFVLFIYNVFGRVLGRVAYGLKIRGRKNLRSVKGAVVTVSNHFSYLDILVTRCCLGWRPFKFVVAPHNTGGKSAVGRSIFLGAGAVPVATTISGARKFNEYLDKCVRKGKAVHFYAERAMWLNYPYPRPFLSGAFTLAARNNVPVVPMFYAYRKKGFLRRMLHMHAPMTAYILPAVYPDPALSGKHRAEQLCRDAEAAVRAAYEAHVSAVR